MMRVQGVQVNFLLSGSRNLFTKARGRKRESSIDKIFSVTFDDLESFIGRPSALQTRRFQVDDHREQEINLYISYDGLLKLAIFRMYGRTLILAKR